MSIELHNVDCMEYMASCEDNAFDLAIVDPPYGIDGNTHRRNDSRSKMMRAKKFHNALWDQPRPSIEFFEDLKRVSKNQIIWGGNHLADLIAEKSSCWLVWDKHTGENNFSDCELAFTSFKTAVRKFSYPWNGMIQGFHGIKSKNETRIHPTQKPIALYKWILENYSKPGQRILDTHLGSGSSAIAAYYFGVDFVGCEIDKVYFNDAKIRIDRETSLTPIEQAAEQASLLAEAS